MLKEHVATSAFPLMSSWTYAELKADIERNGLHEPITLCEGMILDGRSRARACDELGIKPATKECYINPWVYVWSYNNYRIQSAKQRYLIWKHCHEKAKAGYVLRNLWTRAKMSAVTPGVAAWGDRLAARPDLLEKVRLGTLKPDAAEYIAIRDRLAEQKVASSFSSKVKRWIKRLWSRP